MTVPFVILVVFVAVALGLSAFAVWLSWGARGRVLGVEGRMYRHEQQHANGVAEDGRRRHRQGQPALTGAMPRVPVGEPEEGPSTPSGSSSANAGRDYEEEDPLATVEHPAPDARFRRPPPPLPLPGAIGPGATRIDR